MELASYDMDGFGCDPGERTKIPERFSSARTMGGLSTILLGSRPPALVYSCMVCIAVWVCAVLGGIVLGVACAFCLVRAGLDRGHAGVESGGVDRVSLARG